MFCPRMTFWRSICWDLLVFWFLYCTSYSLLALALDVFLVKSYRLSTGRVFHIGFQLISDPPNYSYRFTWISKHEKRLRSSFDFAHVHIFKCVLALLNRHREYCSQQVPIFHPTTPVPKIDTKLFSQRHEALRKRWSNPVAPWHAHGAGRASGSSERSLQRKTWRLGTCDPAPAGFLKPWVP